MASSISRVGTTEPFNLQVSRSQIANHKTQFKFGFNADVDASLETIWTEGGLYSYLSSASVLKISSASANDTSAGTGARTVKISGLDGDYNEVSETVTLSGQTAVNTTNSFIRVFRMEVLTAGTGEKNAGKVYAGTGTVTSGVPANKYGVIAVGDNQTLMALWTVPAGYTAYLYQTTIAAGCTTANKLIEASVLARPDGGVFQVKDRIAHGVGGAHVEQRYHFPLKFEEKTDIEVQALCDAAASVRVSAGLDIVYIKND